MDLNKIQEIFIQRARIRFNRYSNIYTKGLDQVQQSFKYSFSRLVSGIINIQIIVQTNTRFNRCSKIHTVDLNHVQTNVGKKRNQTTFSQGIITESEKRQKKKLLIDYLYANLKNHNFWAYRYFFCEFLGILNVVGALFISLIQFSLSSMWSVPAKHSCKISQRSLQQIVFLDLYI